MANPTMRAAIGRMMLNVDASNTILTQFYPDTRREGKRDGLPLGKRINPLKHAYGHRVAQTSTGTRVLPEGMRPVFAVHE